MSTLQPDRTELLSALVQVFAKYFDQKDEFSGERTSYDKFWGTYLRAMRDEDEARPKDWDGNMGSILTFTGLFAATVAAFVIESYTSLSRDSGDQTVVLLSQILAATTNSSSNPTQPFAPIEPFSAPLPSVIVNALWFASLVVALACALLATLIQQWSRDYVRDIKQRETLDESFESRALNHVYIRSGVDRYGMDKVVNFIVALVHLAVILFAAGLLLFLYPINAAVSACTTFAVGVLGSAYFIAGVMPVRDPSCPYRTPLTYPCTLGYSALLCVGSMILVFCRRMRLDDLRRWFSGIHHSIVDFIFSRLCKCSWFSLTSSQHWDPFSLPWEMHIRPTKRRRACALWIGDMTPSQFQFVWQHISRQLMDSAEPDSHKILFQSALDILCRMRPQVRSQCLAHLLGDDRVATKLDYISRWGSSQYVDLPITLELACLMMGHVSVSKDVWESEQYKTMITSCLFAIFSMLGQIPADVNERCSGSLVLQAHVFLFHLRWTLLILARDYEPDIDVSRSHVDNDRQFFSESLATDVYTEHSGDLVSVIYRNYRALEHPRAFLSLLNSWQYNPLDATEPWKRRGNWTTDMSSCLVPLHDDSCCRRRDGPIDHLAVCTVLTMLVRLLRADETDRDELLESCWVWYSKLWSHDPSILLRWSQHFVMTEEDRRRAPSPEFLTILYDLRLDAWTEPGNDLSYVPPLDTPQGKILAREIWVDTIADILRALTSRVDMTKAPHAGSSQSFQWSPAKSGALLTTDQTEQPVSDPLVDMSPMTRRPSRNPEDQYPGTLKQLPERDSFDLEEVVVDTATDMNSSQPSSNGVVATICELATSMSAQLDADLDLARRIGDANHQHSECIPISATANDHPECIGPAPSTHEAPTEVGEASDGSDERPESSRTGCEEGGPTEDESSMTARLARRR